MRSNEELYKVFFETQFLVYAFTEPPDILKGMHEGVRAVCLAVIDDLIEEGWIVDQSSVLAMGETFPNLTTALIVYKENLQ